MTQDQIDEAFETLHTNYNYSKVKRFDDMLLFFKIPSYCNELMRKEIEQKIKELNLPLYVEHKPLGSLFQDTICVLPVMSN